MEMATEPSDMQLLEGLAKRLDKSLFRTSSDGDKNQQEEAAELHQTAGGSAAGADGSFEELLETTWSWSDLTARPCLASAASERHFSPGSPEETSLHKMLFLPAAALCCLCSALAAMATQLNQEDLTLTSKAGENVLIACSGYDICDSSFVYWYQKKETEPLVAILRHDRSGGKISTFQHPQSSSFSMLKTDLLISECTEAHSATYYCSCQKNAGSGEFNNYLVFGAGTKLYVTNDKVKPPTVRLYSAAPESHQQQKQPLLCAASGMVPVVVQFVWKRRKENGEQEELRSASGEELELRDQGRISSIRLVDQDPRHTYEYSCSVRHEKGIEEAPSKIEIRPPASSPPPPPPPGPVWSRVRLHCLLYSLLVAKSLTYFCGVSLLSICAARRASLDE